MWNELFITYNEESLFCELLSNYTRGPERQLIRILKIKESTCRSIKLGNVPFLVTSLGENITSITEIAKFICSLTGTSDTLFGRSDKEIQSHISFISDYIKASNKLDFLENVLFFNSFCNGYHITISDLFAYAMIIVSIQHLTETEKNKYFNVLRWALHIQGLKGISDQILRLKMNIYAPSEKLFIDLSGKSKKVEGKENKKKEGKEQNNENQEHKKEKKDKAENTKPDNIEKKEKKPQQQQQKAPVKKEEDNRHPCSKLDLRVGKIVSIVENKDSDKLYNEKIDMGNGEIRKIASGLKNRIPLDKLKDQFVVVLCNLKERTLCGWPSHGMLLCANKTDGTVDFLKPPKNSKPGDLVTIGTFERKPDEQLHAKKSPWDLVKDKLTINEEGNASFDEVNVWSTPSGNITCPNMKLAVIS